MRAQTPTRSYSCIAVTTTRLILCSTQNYTYLNKNKANRKIRKLARILRLVERVQAKKNRKRSAKNPINRNICLCLETINSVENIADDQEKQSYSAVQLCLHSIHVVSRCFVTSSQANAFLHVKQSWDEPPAIIQRKRSG